MAAERAKSSLLAKLMGRNFVKSYQAHKDDVVVLPGGGRLPAGIEGGVAKLTELKFGIYQSGEHEGKPYFSGRATVVHPKEHDGLPIFGLFTYLQPIPLCDTPKATKYKTYDDNFSRVLNELKVLNGGEPIVIESEDPLEAIEECLAQMDALCDEDNPVYFRFRTWKGTKQKSGPYKDKEPRTVEEWGETVSWDESEDVEAATEDDTAVSESDEDEEVSESDDSEEIAREEVEKDVKDAQRGRLQPLPSKFKNDAITGRTNVSNGGTTKRVNNSQKVDISNDNPDGAADEPSLEQLAKLADQGNKVAARMLTNLANQHGLSEEEISNASSWESVLFMMEEKVAGTTHESADHVDNVNTALQNTLDKVVKANPAPSAANGDIKVGTCYKYRPLDAKKQPGNPIEVEAIKVNDRIKTADVVRLDDRRKGWKNVKWSDLTILT